ncbi:uncharacterized protein LAJ45_01097 [Morchella importuna]|uniref:uncharacterized protein n=1 Tax=Morchella importuna TaxID=1174673 RepID=UPI001E8E3B82|nr:uncharacterized protein LAJ45_01097 [Morchella importuna]KAH8154569.1 hypothetical protein LAJ45_01097 [Morchella importuna]
MSSVSSLSSLDSEDWSDKASAADTVHSRDETADWSVASATESVLSRDETLSSVNSTDWSVAGATESSLSRDESSDWSVASGSGSFHSRVASIEPTENMDHPQDSEVVDENEYTDESEDSDDDDPLDAQNARSRLVAAYNAEPAQEGAYTYVEIDAPTAYSDSSISLRSLSTMTNDRAPPHVVFAGYHPTLYFRPKTFTLRTSLERAVEATNMVHRWAHARLHILMLTPPPQVETPNPFADYKCAYDNDTVRALNDAATFYRLAEYGAPAVTPEEMVAVYPASIWDESPKCWLGSGGMVGRLLHGLLWTSYEERERLYLTYPEFWDVVRCPECGVPREMGVWCNHGDMGNTA